MQDTQQFSITEASLTDHQSLLTLYGLYRKESYLNTEPDELQRYLEEHLQRKDSKIFIASYQERGVGFMHLTRQFSLLKHFWFVQDLFVTPEARKNGIAIAFLNAAKALAQQDGSKQLRLRTAVTNQVAQQLFTQVEFQKIKSHLYYEWHEKS